MKNKTKKISFLGIATSVALILAYIEAILPPIWTAVPGIKVGLPNLIIILILYRFGFKEAVIVSGIRLIIVTILFGNAMTLAYSVAGAVLSLLVMGILKKTDKFSTVGVSIVGAVCHNLGQIIVAIFLFDTVQIGYYMIVLAITGTIAGVFIGVGSSLLLRRTENLKI
ncbi:MAG: Gx transporter family protein [Clostridia bacterium]|nr:Gx transporter family protein [Clostridia bacterium]